MTKIQRLEERVRLDDDMCKRINKILNGLEARTDEYKYPKAVGEIRAVMQYCGRGEESEIMEVVA
jgi:hypothetical protein